MLTLRAEVRMRLSIWRMKIDRVLDWVGYQWCAHVRRVSHSGPTLAHKRWSHAVVRRCVKPRSEAERAEMVRNPFGRAGRA